MGIVIELVFSFPRASEPVASEQYVRVASDLLDRIPNQAPRSIAGLYVEPSVEAVLARRFPNAKFISLDAPDALRGNHAPVPTANGEFDLIYSNGDLEMLPSLRQLLPNLVTRLSQGGSLAVQVPNNLYEPNRALLRMVAADGPWSKKLLPIAKTRPFNETMEGLYALLSLVCASVDIWETTYLYAVNGVEAIVDLMKAHSLAPFVRPLDESSRRRFLDRYVTELARAYPTQRDGKVLLRFPRIFVLARR